MAKATGVGEWHRRYKTKRLQSPTPPSDILPSHTTRMTKYTRLRTKGCRVVIAAIRQRQIRAREATVEVQRPENQSLPAQSTSEAPQPSSSKPTIPTFPKTPPRRQLRKPGRDPNAPPPTAEQLALWKERSDPFSEYNLFYAPLTPVCSPPRVKIPSPSAFDVAYGLDDYGRQTSSKKGKGKEKENAKPAPFKPSARLGRESR